MSFEIHNTPYPMLDSQDEDRSADRLEILLSRDYEENGAWPDTRTGEA